MQYGLVLHLPGQEIDDQSIPPVRVVTEEKHWPVRRKSAQMLQPPARDGVEGATGRSPKIGVEQRIEDSGLIGGDHAKSLPQRLD